MLIQIPTGPVDSNGYAKRLQDSISLEQRRRLHEILAGLKSSNAVLKSGEPVQHEIDAVRWILEQPEFILPT